MKCPMCSSDLHWENDFTYEDYGADGDGVVLVYSCHNESCDADLIQTYVNN